MPGAPLGFSGLHPGAVIDGFRLMKGCNSAAPIATRAPCAVMPARLPGRAGLAPAGDEVETGPDTGFGVQISCAGIDARRHRR